MMKKWEAPRAEVQTFAANEYVAACGNGGTWYKFKCTTAGWFGEGGRVFEETNGKDGLQLFGDEYLGEYTPCAIEHIASSEDDFTKGYFISVKEVVEGKATPVVIWTGANDDNIHCTNVLDKEDWEPLKS